MTKGGKQEHEFCQQYEVGKGSANYRVKKIRLRQRRDKGKDALKSRLRV
jgi:hypothetical protein